MSESVEDFLGFLTGAGSTIGSGSIFTYWVNEGFGIFGITRFDTSGSSVGFGFLFCTGIFYSSFGGDGGFGSYFYTSGSTYFTTTCFGFS